MQIHIINCVLATPAIDKGIVTAAFIGKNFGSLKQASQLWDYAVEGLQ